MYKKESVCFNEIIFIIMKMKMKKRSHRYINRIRPRHGYKYTKYKTGLRMMILTYVKQHLSNI